MVLFHGSPILFDRFDLSKAGEGTGVKFGFGVYLTESESSAVHYSQPRKVDIVENHYLYTVEIPELTEDNHLSSALPVHESIVARVEEKLGVEAPSKIVAQGKEFRKWVGMTLTGSKKNGFAEEKAAAELLDSVGVLYNVWPQAQNKPDGLKNIAVFNADNVKIVKREHIEVELKCKKWVLVEGSKLKIES